MGKYTSAADLQYLNSVSKYWRKPRGFLITYMGCMWTLLYILSNYWQIEAAAGTSPGRLVETNAEGDIIHQFPEDAAGNLNILQDNFNPHGLTVDWEKNVILTSDFIVPVTILKPTLGKISDNTLRLWNLSARKIISTITIPNVCHFAVRR